MPKPLISAEAIYDAALALLDEQGAQALSARNLSARLKCSTRTLYQQVGKREELIAGLVQHHLSGLQLEFQPGDCWQHSAANWALALRGALLDHPNLARLMTMQHRGPIVGYVNVLLKLLLDNGFDEELALRACRVLVNITVSLTLSEIIAPDPVSRHRGRSQKEIRFEDLVISRSGRDPEHFQQPPEVFDNAIAWTITGIEREQQGTDKLTSVDQ